MVDYVETIPDADGSGDGDGVKSEFLDMGGLVEKKMTDEWKKTPHPFLLSHISPACAEII